MEEASIASEDASDNRTIVVRGFPMDSEASSVVVASALHRTYKIRTVPNMVTFYNNGDYCAVKLSSSADRRRVLQLCKQGTYPIFHNRDPHQPSVTLEILSEMPTEVRGVPPTPDMLYSATGSTGSPALFGDVKSTLDMNPTASIIQLSGLPGTSNMLWDGVRMTSTVIASMIHRTYGVRTNPDSVVFNDSRTKCWIDLASPIRAQKVVESYEQSGLAPVLHHHSMDQSEPSSHLTIHLSSYLDYEFYASNALYRLQHPTFTSNDLGSESAQYNGTGKETITLSGFPGEDPMWRFLTENVIASLLHRNFGIRTSATGVRVSGDKRYCQVELSPQDAKHLLKAIYDGENRVAVYHRDRRVGTLTLERVMDSVMDRDHRTIGLEPHMDTRAFGASSVQQQWHHEQYRYDMNQDVGAHYKANTDDTWKFDSMKSVLNEEAHRDAPYEMQQAQFEHIQPRGSASANIEMHQSSYSMNMTQPITVPQVTRLEGESVPREQSLEEDEGYLNTLSFQFDSSDNLNLFINEEN